MARTPKHRFDEAEAEAAWLLLTDQEREEYRGLALAGGISTAGNERLRELDTLGYTLLKEKNEQA